MDDGKEEGDEGLILQPYNWERYQRFDVGFGSRDHYQRHQQNPDTSRTSISIRTLAASQQLCRHHNIDVNTSTIVNFTVINNSNNNNNNNNNGNNNNHENMLTTPLHHLHHHHRNSQPPSLSARIATATSTTMSTSASPSLCSPPHPCSSSSSSSSSATRAPHLHHNYHISLRLEVPNH
ncbi:hypothetical protein E2C01_060806 [Portunus trituberculatus]|uniref:Uncharacterized protein n=1 Tax=Portunus trituberculatus TaxID=210409 RepID=A0A5B7H9Q3_PORTR|nr:hypothetical protein [Portunus trituberculatus]